MKPKRWNHNLHYHPLILAAAPDSCAYALDVGCGEGVLTRDLCSVSAHVVGLDCHAPSIALARAQGGDRIAYVLGDVLSAPLTPASFDLVTSVATLHHMHPEAGLTCMANLVRPGGCLVVIGLARSSRLADYVFDVAGAIATRVYRRILRKPYWEHSAPKVWPPPLSYAEIRRTAERVLPGVRYRRHVLWRYSLVWRRPLSM